MPSLITHPSGRVTYSNKLYPRGKDFKTSNADLSRAGDEEKAWIATRSPLEEPKREPIPVPESSVEAFSNLGLSIETNFPATSRTRSRTMQPKARHRSREALYVLEQVVHRDNMTFFTGTVPSELVKFATEKIWSQVMDVFLKRVRRLLDAAGIKLIDFWVKEVHPERSVEAQEVILHVHMVFAGRKPYNHWAITPKEFTEMWKESWEAVLPDESKGLYWGASTNVQRVKKSVKNYFSKYLSKGTNDELLPLLESLPDTSIPRNWAAMSQNLGRLLERNTYRYQGEAARAVIDYLCHETLTLGLRWYPVLMGREDGTCFDIAGAFYGLDPPGIKFREW